MSWHMHDREFVEVTGLPAAKRYEYFVKRAVDWECVWGLRSEKGWTLASGPEGRTAFPVWPHPRLACACSVNQWAASVASEIPLDEFLDRWLAGLARDDRDVAVFPTPQDEGIVVCPERLAADLRDECRQYE